MPRLVKPLRGLLETGHSTEDRQTHDSRNSQGQAPGEEGTKDENKEESQGVKDRVDSSTQTMSCRTKYFTQEYLHTQGL